MSGPFVRATAIAVLLWREHLLAARYPHADGAFYRPLGGGIEFGERAVDAVRREFLEELGREIEVVEQLGVAENIFELDGEPGHQVMFEFITGWPDGHEPADLEPLLGREENGELIDARWPPLSEVLAGSYTLYPDGLAERLEAWLATS